MQPKPKNKKPGELSEDSKKEIEEHFKVYHPPEKPISDLPKFSTFKPEPIKRIKKDKPNLQISFDL